MGNGGGLVGPLGDPAHFVPDLIVIPETGTAGLGGDLMVMLGQPGAIRSKHLDREIRRGTASRVPVGNRADSRRGGGQVGNHPAGRDGCNCRRSTIKSGGIGSRRNLRMRARDGLGSARKVRKGIEPSRCERPDRCRGDPVGKDRPVADRPATSRRMRSAGGIVKGDGCTMGVLVRAQQFPMKVLDRAPGFLVGGLGIPAVAELPDRVTGKPGHWIGVIANGDDVLAGGNLLDVGNGVRVIGRTHPMHRPVIADRPRRVGLQVLVTNLSRSGNAGLRWAGWTSVMVKAMIINERLLAVHRDPVSTRRTATG